jgi:hypothetical protein
MAEAWKAGVTPTTVRAVEDLWELNVAMRDLAMRQRAEEEVRRERAEAGNDEGDDDIEEDIDMRVESLGAPPDYVCSYFRYPKGREPTWFHLARFDKESDYLHRMVSSVRRELEATVPADQDPIGSGAINWDWLILGDRFRFPPGTYIEQTSAFLVSFARAVLGLYVDAPRSRDDGGGRDWEDMWWHEPGRRGPHNPRHPHPQGADAAELLFRGNRAVERRRRLNDQCGRMLHEAIESYVAEKTTFTALQLITRLNGAYLVTWADIESRSGPRSLLQISAERAAGHFASLPSALPQPVADLVQDVRYMRELGPLPVDEEDEEVNTRKRGRTAGVPAAAPSTLSLMRALRFVAGV